MTGGLFLLSCTRYLEKVNKLFDFIRKKQLCDYIRELSKQIVKDILSRFPEGEIIAEEDKKILENHVIDYLLILLKH
ncbi:hypothetical protein WH8501_08150 [Crocosphaera watsonii WH 8501]|uniref:hypothetical protein n=1 Tax=Crocosphaera watsonii TaxID=263511 RepID=UPI0005B25CAE